MMRKLILALTLLVCASAQAGHYADLYVIPVASHVPGANGTMWMSDLAVQNFQTTPITVQVVVIESVATGNDNIFPLTTPTANGSVTIPAGGSALLSDVLAGHRGMSATIGALLVGADRPFAVTSRSYSMAPSGDTVGQTVLPARDFLDNTLGSTDLATAVAYVPGLIQNANFRTNLGMVAANGSAGNTALRVRITLRNAAGTVIGTREISVSPGAVTQMQFSARSMASGDFNIGSAEFRIIEGSGSIVPYASVIDNRTADAVYVTGEFPDNEIGFGKGLAVHSLFRRIMEQYR